jgi:hypothetical protein
MTEHLSSDQLPHQLEQMRNQIDQAVMGMSDHEGHVSKFCRAI